MRALLTTVFLLMASVGSHAGDIEMTISPIDIPYPITSSASTNFPEGSRMQADFFACVRNAGTNSVRLYEEWNSWGYGQPKIVCVNGWREFWIVKQPGVWHRNFSAKSFRPRIS